MANAYTIYIGSSFIWPMTWKDANGDPIVLTGMTFNFRLLKGSRVLLNLTTGEAATARGSQLTVVDANAGTLKLKITDEETDNFRPTASGQSATGIMKYTDSAGDEDVMFKKAFTIEKG